MFLRGVISYMTFGLFLRPLQLWVGLFRWVTLAGGGGLSIPIDAVAAQLDLAQDLVAFLFSPLGLFGLSVWSAGRY